MATQKTLVRKVLGLGKMHMSAKKWSQDSKVCYITCTNKGPLGRKLSEVLLGASFCEEYFFEMLVCHVWYFS
jgi:hypothetical protein